MTPVGASCSLRWKDRHHATHQATAFWVLVRPREGYWYDFVQFQPILEFASETPVEDGLAPDVEPRSS